MGLVLAVLVSALLQGLVLAVLVSVLLQGLVPAVLVSVAVELPPFGASLVPREFLSPRLSFAAYRLLLLFAGLFLPRPQVKLVALPLPGPPNVARGPLLLDAGSGTPRLGLYCCRPKLRTSCERLRKRRSIHYVEKLLAGWLWLANAQPSLYLDTECVNPCQANHGMSLPRHRVCQSR